MRPCIWALATAETRVAAPVAPISRMEAHVMERKGEPGEARLHYDQRAEECGKLGGRLRCAPRLRHLIEPRNRGAPPARPNLSHIHTRGRGG